MTQKLYIFRVFRLFLHFHVTQLIAYCIFMVQYKREMTGRYWNMTFHCTDPTECNIYIGLTEYYLTSGKKWGSGVAQPTQSLVSQRFTRVITIYLERDMKFALLWECQPHGGSRGRLRESPKPVSFGQQCLYTFSCQSITIVVQIFWRAPHWWTNNAILS